MIKLLDLNSIRSRMVSGFLFLVLLILLLAFVSLYLLDRTNRIASIHGHISQLEIYTLILFKNDNDFFDLESTNEKYFTSHQSSFLKRRDSLLAIVNRELQKVFSNTKNKSYAIDQDLLSIDSALTHYDVKFKQLENLVYARGLKDHGIEGKMRQHAHLLEESGHGISAYQILNLRRHEKDFFLRHDTVYVALFRQRADALLTDLLKKEVASRFEIYHLQEYKRLFLELVDIQQKIGLTSSSGLRNELNKLTFSISNQYLALTQYSYNLSSSAQQKAGIFYFILLAGAIVFSILSGIWISRRLSDPIARLSRQVENVNAGEPGSRIDYDLKNAANEVQTLAHAFNQLLERSEFQMDEIKAKSKLLRKKNKQLKMLNKELDNFLYSTAHDLRSPLTSLLGLINLFGYETERKAIDGYSHMMRESVLRMENFISQIVSYSKNKRLDLFIEKINIAWIIDSIIQAHKFIDGAHRIAWQVDVRENVPIFTDLNRMTILFNNLISNAVKYADYSKAAPFISVQVRSDFDSIYIQFIDNGIGISQEHIDRIFDMFYRADNNSKGSGLGLYILKQTIKRMKGIVRVESILGEGTKFFITIPNQVKFISPSKDSLLSLN